MEWLIDELVDDGDEVVCLRVVDPNSEVAMGAKGRDYREEAVALMKSVEEKNRENKAVNLILEFAVGKVEKMFTRMVCVFSILPLNMSLYLVLPSLQNRDLGEIDKESRSNFTSPPS